jgi:hypothetical protein
MFNNSCASLQGRRGGKRLSALLLIVALAVFTLMAGCSKGYSRFLKLPADPQIDSELGWAIVTSAYAQIKKMPDSRSPELAIARKGMVFRCLARKIDPEGQDLGGFWYEYSDGPIQGWIHSADLSVFSSEEQARAASLQQE